MAYFYNGDLASMMERLLLAIMLSSIFGWEREKKNRAAGLRTHILVCVGATLITLVSQSYAYVGGWSGADPTRITAQIVSGIGFLGAGTIIIRGASVRGLTTAASLWVAAAIGIAVARGGDFLIVATATSLIVLFVLTVVDRLEDRLIAKQKRREVTIHYLQASGSDSDLAAIFHEMNLEIRGVERLDESDTAHRTTFDLKLTSEQSFDAVNTRLLQLPWVRRVEWD
jgi:putative Mg2+ transporter-C (MgtC) family protein